MSNNIVLRAENIYKKTGKNNIVDDISLELREGDILGFIGPNGAGKTTTIKLLLGLQSLTQGNIKICNHDLKKEFSTAIINVGAIIENPDHYLYMSGYENLKISAMLYNLPDEKILEVAKLVGLENKIYDKVKKYSLGMRQRLGIAQAIIHNPKILILDEPMNGLDPEGIKNLKILLKRLAFEKNMAIIISSHLLSELESFCNRVVILSKGKIIKDISINQIKKIAHKSNYILELSTTNLNQILLQYEVLDNSHIKINTTKESFSNILKTLLLNNINIYEIKKETTSLEEIFINNTKGIYNE